MKNKELENDIREECDILFRDILIRVNEIQYNERGLMHLKNLAYATEDLNRLDLLLVWANSQRGTF